MAGILFCAWSQPSLTLGQADGLDVPAAVAATSAWGQRHSVPPTSLQSSAVTFTHNPSDTEKDRLGSH